MSGVDTHLHLLASLAGVILQGNAGLKEALNKSIMSTPTYQSMSEHNLWINESLQELSETFDLLDVDKDGRLSRNEIAALLRTVNVEPTRVELDFIFQEMDTDRTGKINKEEFVRYMRSPPVHRTTLKELENQFRKFDADGDGAVTEDEMAQILKQTANLTDRESIANMFRATDTNGDGRITFLEFVKMMQE